MIPIPTGNSVPKLPVTAVVIGSSIAGVNVVMSFTSLLLVMPIHKLTEEPVKRQYNNG